MLSNICSLKPFTSSSPDSSTPICEVYAEHGLISEHNVSPVLHDLSCMLHGPLQTGLEMSMCQGDTYARSLRPQITLLQPSKYCLRENKDPAALARSFRKEITV
jgi:hypothetical protein